MPKKPPSKPKALVGEVIENPVKKRKSPRAKKSGRLTAEQTVLSQQILQLRLSGKTCREIGQILGRDRVNVWKHIVRALEEIKAEIRADADELRALELGRLDKLLFAVWTNALKGDLPAIATALRIAERRAKLLGLDAPTQITTPKHQPFELLAGVVSIAKPDDVDLKSLDELQLVALYRDRIAAEPARDAQPA